MTPTAFTCALCGLGFDHGQACGGCPASRHCEVIHCPRCGYSFPRTSRLVAWLKRGWARIRGGVR